MFVSDILSQKGALVFSGSGTVQGHRLPVLGAK